MEAREILFCPVWICEAVPLPRVAKLELRSNGIPKPELGNEGKDDINLANMLVIPTSLAP